MYTYVCIYMVAPPLIHIFCPLQPTQAGLAQHLHSRGRAPLNVHAAPKFLGHLGFESRLKSKIEDCRTSFSVIFNHPWTFRAGVSKVSKMFQI